MDNCDLVPFPLPFCRRWVPCTNECTCLRSDRPQNASDPVTTPAGLRKCAEFEPCTKDCVCSIRSVTSYLNPDKLDPLSMVCDLGVCNTTCFCRVDLLKSLTAVLFPNTTTKFDILWVLQPLLAWEFEADTVTAKQLMTNKRFWKWTYRKSYLSQSEDLGTVHIS